MYSAISRLSSFLFLGLIIFGTWEAKRSPLTILVLSIALILAGIPLFIYGLIKMKRYKNIFDYQKTIFWGQENNGKGIREILTAFNVVGIWCFLAGVLLLMGVLP